MRLRLRVCGDLRVGWGEAVYIATGSLCSKKGVYKLYLLAVAVALETYGG